MNNLNAHGSSAQERIRYEAIDMIRALAIILMIIFHGSFDLTLYGYLSIDFSRDPFWWAFPRVIVFLFLLPMGQSMQIAHAHKIKWSDIKKRMIKLVTCALIISVSTYVSFPDKWIYFGTLHCIAVCSLLILPFLDHPYTSLAFALFITIPLFFGFRWPWFQMEHSSMDYIPALPWLAVVLLGVFSVKVGSHKFRIPNFRTKKLFLAVSKHSLIIYLLHQPILFGLVWCLHSIRPAH